MGECEQQYGPVWYERRRLSIGGVFYSLSCPAFSFVGEEYTAFFPPDVGITDIRLPPPSPTLLALLADLPHSGCWPAVVDRLIEEYQETEPHVMSALSRAEVGEVSR